MCLYSHQIYDNIKLPGSQGHIIIKGGKPVEKLTISVSEMQKALGIGRNTAYELVNRADFPAVRLGKRIVIPVEGLAAWLKARGMEQGHDGIV